MRGVTLTVGLVLASCGVAYAQPQGEAAFVKHHVEIGAGLVWSGGYDIGDRTAQLRTNATGLTPPAFTLFQTSSSIEAGPGLEMNVGFALSRSLMMEAGVWLARPRLSVKVSQDVEAPPQKLEGERLHQIAVSAGGAWLFPSTRRHRVRPFLSANASYLRQLHEERTLVKTGRSASAGVGLRMLLHGVKPRTRMLGARADLRVNWRSGGVDFESASRLFPSISFTLFAGL